MKESIDKIKSIKDDGRVPSEPIKKWLINKCKENNDFCILVNKTNTDKLFSYIYEEVKKKLNSKNGWIDDSVVYNIAESYFGKVSNSDKKEEVKKDSNVIDFKAKTEKTSKGKAKKNKADTVVDNQISIFDL